MDSKQRDLDDLYQMVFDLITDLSTIFIKHEEKQDLIVVELFYKRLHKNMVMKRIIKNVIPYKEQIVNRDIKFFDDNHFIFNSLREDRFIYYRDIIIEEKRLNKENMQMLWQYLDAFVALAESYSS